MIRPLPRSFGSSNAVPPLQPAAEDVGFGHAVEHCILDLELPELVPRPGGRL